MQFLQDFFFYGPGIPITIIGTLIIVTATCFGLLSHIEDQMDRETTDGTPIDPK